MSYHTYTWHKADDYRWQYHEDSFNTHQAD